MARRYTVKDLARAQVHATSYAGKHPDLDGFHSARYRAMARAFGVGGVGVGGVGGSSRDRVASRELEYLEKSAVRMLVGLHSPFDDYLEAPRSVRDLHARFGRPIREGIDATRSAVEELLAAVLVQRHGIPADRTVDDRDLLRFGFDPATPWPDEFEYF